jgi:broad specificity phosphatase PhoE
MAKTMKRRPASASSAIRKRPAAKVMPPGQRSGAQAARCRLNKIAPKRLILVRHGESEGNVNQSIYSSKADNALHLTETGWNQALSAGRALREIVGSESIHFFVSPYVRTRETFHAIAKAWGGFENLSWKEDPRIREQDFGNFQDPDETKKYKQERKDFGSFYYRFPDGGESCADVYDRVSSFLESLYRHWEKRNFDNEVLVCHGLTIAAFFMRWNKYSVDEFNTYENFTNCEMAVLEKETSEGKLTLKYIVKNESGVPVRQEGRCLKPSHKCDRREMRYD